jgi:MYXO-CTERM domain-containing protein
MNRKTTHAATAALALVALAATSHAAVDLTAGTLYAGAWHTPPGSSYIEYPGQGTFSTPFEYGSDDEGNAQIGSITSSLAFSVTPSNASGELSSQIVGGDPDQTIYGGPAFELFFNVQSPMPYSFDYLLTSAVFGGIYVVEGADYVGTVFETYGGTGLNSGVLEPGTYALYISLDVDISGQTSGSGSFNFNVPAPGALLLPAAGLLAARRRR